ncbi:MAG: TIGR03790 family protein [Verrucomicrobiota bacterium]
MAHEVLLLVNKNSQPSMLAANTFAAARQIPKMNMVYLDVPESAYGGTATVTPEEFTKLIWEPANAVAKERGIEDRILAWVYSVDFPIRVKTDPGDRRQMSVGGLTFMRNKVPGLNLVEEGKYLSKLFSGPNGRIKLNLNALSLGVHKSGMGMDAKVPPEAAYLQGGLGARMPLPSMMLGYIGEKGTSIDTVIQTIQRGKSSDYRGLRSGIHFVMSDDVRSKCREWQYYPAVNELKQRGVRAVVTTNFPAGAENVMGVLVGAETVDPSSVKSFAPGAMAEHLTSWSAEFQKRQTKLTAWLEAGATASAGAVVEPYSNPDKFPSARFFVHYSSGCTMLESFYQSIACPLQSLLLGDPLAKPYAVPLAVNMFGSNRIDMDFTYAAQAKSNLRGAEYLYSFMLDGKEIREESDDSSVYIRASRLADGYHELCVVARVDHSIQFGGVAIKPFTIDCMGRSVSILPGVVKTGSYTHGIKVEIGGTEMPEKLRLVSGEQMLDEKAFAADAQLELDELKIGEGPNRIRVVAIYADGMEVSSKPVAFEIKFNTES